MEHILLNKNKTALVSDIDFDELKDLGWFSNKQGNTLYVVRNEKHKGEGKRRKITMHRQVLGLSKGDGKMVDHINGNGLDNRRCNLRICTGTQNQQNRKIQHGTSEFKGVHWNKRSEKWQSQIKFNKKRRHLGCFNSETEAAKAYDRAAKNLFGEFARPNFN